MRKHPQAEDVPYIIISVTDTGLGIEEDKLKRIFEPFYTTKDIGRGSGLGLAVVYGIVNAHKGYIEVASIVGGGTTFGLYFPAIEGTMHPDPPPVVAEDPNISGSELIFIIEDETMLLNIVRTHVESFGYRVLVAQDGEEALKIFKEQHENIDVVLSDLGLPKIDGMQLFREFKKLQPDIPFIVASGFFDAKMHSQLEEGGVSAIITKPYEMEKLLRTIRSVLRS
jgi:CheY-like chemotaxis protein